jgi:hypothetical protein
LLNTLCCHWHEFNLASLFSTKNLTPMKQIKRFHWAGGASRMNLILVTLFTLSGSKAKRQSACGGKKRAERGASVDG